MKTIAERNAEFELMDPAQKRVAIARDVLMRLDDRELFARRGIYAARASELMGLYPGELGAACSVCAIGAAAVSLRDGEVIGRSGLTMVDALAGIFDEPTLRRMERVFEGDVVIDTDFLPGEPPPMWDDDVYVCYPRRRGILGQRTVEQAADADRVLRAIYQNIIDNDGEFDIRPFAEEAVGTRRTSEVPE